MIDEKKLIDADKLIEAIYELNVSKPNAPLEFVVTLGMVLTLIENQPKISIENKTSDKWIPCSERLPDKDRKYLVATDGTYGIDAIDIAMYENGKWLKSSKILAWMYLPEPYKGE